MTSKPIIKKIKLTKEQQEEIETIKKGMSVSKTTIVKNATRKYEYEYTTKARPLSERQQKDKLRKIYGGLCCVCGGFSNYNISYDMDGAKRVERYCKKHFDKWQKETNKK